MKRPKLNKKALRRSFFGSIGRLLGVFLGAGAGSLVHQLLGGGLNGWGAAGMMAAAAFVCMWAAEYKKES